MIVVIIVVKSEGGGGGGIGFICYYSCDRMIGCNVVIILIWGLGQL